MELRMSIDKKKDEPRHHHHHHGASDHRCGTSCHSREESKSAESAVDVQECDASECKMNDHDAISELLIQIESLQKEADENKEKFIRTVADMENFRKRAMRDRDEMRSNTIRSLVEELFPIIDSLQIGLTLRHQSDEAKNIAKGFQLTYDLFVQMLKQYGVKQMNPENAIFDPQQHECISHISSDTVPADTIIQVVRLGYVMHDKLIRPASVIVSSGPSTHE